MSISFIPDTVSTASPQDVGVLTFIIDNILIFGASGGGFAICLLVGIVICVLRSKKKPRHESQVEIPLQPIAKGKFISWRCYRILR